MCKNKIIIKNKRYQPTKKNGYTKETPRDRRLSYIEIPCGECKECKKKRKEMWAIAETVPPLQFLLNIIGGDSTITVSTSS